MKKILIFSGHFGQWPFKAGIHYLTEFFIRRNYSVQFITVGNSCLTAILSMTGSGSRLRLKESLKFLLSQGSRTENNVTSSSLFSLYHPVNLYPSFLARYTQFLQYKSLAKNFLSFSYPSLSRLLRKTSFEDFDMVMIESGLATAVWDHLPKGKFTIFRISDAIDKLGYGHYFKELEKEIIRQADIVLAVSRPIYDQAKKIKGNTHGLWQLPNGADLKLFDSLPVPLPGEYAAIKPPRAIYAGNTNMLDRDLLLYLVRSLPGVSFVIIGPRLKIRNIYPNLYLLGPRERNVLPSYIKNADVGLIPFKTWQFKDTERPIKFYDYLASGLPIVSTSFGQAKSMEPYARVVDNSIGFLRAIEDSLTWSGEDRIRQMQAARQFSWETLYEEFSRILAEAGAPL
jgi:glycosyltransferase involved in cell wall biosynthesis